MLAQPLESETTKCLPREQNTRHDYVDDDCEGCKLRRELGLRHERLLGYRRRLEEGSGKRAVTRGDGDVVGKMDLQRDFVLYRDVDETGDTTLGVHNRQVSSEIVGGQDEMPLSHDQALRTVESGELILDEEHEDARGLRPSKRSEHKLSHAEQPHRR